MKSNFYFSFFFLPPEEKRALIHFYTFCRELDDQVDLDTAYSSPDGKIKIINGWREEIARTFEGDPRHPLTRSLLPVIRAYRLSRSYFDEILNGMEMDITHTSYETFGDLKLYCYRVASAVGLVSMEIFGDRSQNARETAVHLGIALQLTNILRDLFADLEKGRVYLPGEDFVRFGYSREDLKRRAINVEFANLIQFEIERARSYYRKGSEGLRLCDNKGKKVITVMERTYDRLLSKIERRTWTLDRGTVSLSLFEKLTIAGRVWLERPED